MPLKEDLAQQIRDATYLDVWDKFFDPDSALYEWTLLQQLEVDMRLRSALRDSRQRSLDAFDELFTEKCWREAFDFLKDQPLDNRMRSDRTFEDTPISTVFERHTLPAPIKEWLAKQGTGIPPDAIRIVSTVEHTPYYNIFADSIYESYSIGGETALAEFNIAADFNMIDPLAESYAQSYAIRLSESISGRIQDEVKYAIIEGMRAGEEMSLIRNRILEVWDRPIPVHVRPRLDPETGRILRQGYSYYLKPDNWAMMTARTETLRWFNEGKLEGHQQMGVQYVEYQATGDHRTCTDCEGYQGEVFSVEDAHGLLPLHCRCRCTWRPIVGDPTRVMKNFPIDVFQDDSAYDLEAMMARAVLNFETTFDLRPPEEASNPFDRGTLEAEIFERLMPIIAREVLEEFVAGEVGDHQEALERIAEVEETARDEGVVIGRWRRGEYKIVGVER